VDYLTVEGVRPYDGRYEFDLRGSTFSVREWGWIKRYSGYLPLTIDEGLAGSDAELMAVFALIALSRARRLATEDVPDAWERFADAPGVVTVRLELTREVAAASDADDPPPRKQNGNAADSGDDSRTSSEISDETRRATGTPGSASSASRPVPVWET
jgi:hypothetical protein